MASTQTQLRRGTYAQAMAGIPAEGELFVDMTNDRLNLGDGIKAGGFAIPNYSDLQEQVFTYVADSGTLNNIVLDLGIDPDGWVEGLSFEFKAAFTNTSTVNVTVVGLSGSKALNKLSGTNVVALSGGEVVAGGIYRMTYNGTAMQIVSTSQTVTPSLSLGTPQALSGPSVTFSGIPAGTKFIKFSYFGQGNASSTNGPHIRVGTGGSVVTSGYSGGYAPANGAAAVAASSFQVLNQIANTTFRGVSTLTLEDAATNTWLCTTVCFGSGNIWTQAGSISLAGTLDRLQILLITGSFVSGNGNIIYN